MLDKQEAAAAAEEKTKSSSDDDNIPSDGGAADITNEDLATPAAPVSKLVAPIP